MRGALAIVTNVRRDAVDAGSRLTSVVLAYGEIDWVRRPDAGVKFEGGQRCPRAMVSQKAGSPGRSRISRKAIAWGRPVCSPLNLYARGQHIPMQHACETAGAARTRSSPRPLCLEGGRDAKLRAHCAARIRADAYQRHCERSEAIQRAAERKTGLLRSARNDDN